MRFVLEFKDIEEYSFYEKDGELVYVKNVEEFSPYDLDVSFIRQKEPKIVLHYIDSKLEFHKDFTETSKKFNIPKDTSPSTPDNVFNKIISTKFLKDILKNTSNKSAIKFIKSWINRSDKKKMVHLSDKEYNIFSIIKTGGPYPKDFSTKN